MTLFRTMTTAAALLCCAAVATAQETDYSKLPEAPSRMAAALGSSKVSLEAALSLGVASYGDTDMVPVSIVYNESDGGYKMRFLPNSMEQVFIDAQTGEVARRISLLEASQLVSQSSAGARVSGVFLDDGVFRGIAYDDSHEHLVRINPLGGEVIDVQRRSGGLPGEPVTGAMTTTDSGLRYYDIVEGDGDAPANSTATVEVHYTGWLVDGTKFDSSVDRGETVSFPLNRVIPGWTEGVGSMRVGGKRKLIIPFELAYGPDGRPGSIPPRAMLVFDVELFAVQASP